MSLTLAAKTVAAQTARDDRWALIRAHVTAARFHEAMADALDAQDEIESAASPQEVDPYWRKKFQDALGKAVVALREMPVKWQAVLEAELPK